MNRGPVALLLASAAAASPLPKPEPWLDVTTANFRLFGNASESKIRDVGLELERLRATLAVFLPAHSPNAPRPTHVFVFRNDSSFEPYAPVVAGKPVTARGYFVATSERNDIAVTASWNTDFREVVYHEYLHFYLNANFPRRPLWFDEGCAEYYSTFRATEGEARVGIVSEEFLRVLRTEGVLPVDRILAVTRESPEYRDETPERRIFYAESWALVHYLSRGAPEREGQLGRYLAALQAGHPLPQAFQEAFQTDPARFTAELRRYVGGGRFHNLVIKSRDLKVPTETTSAPMSRPDVLARLGGLLGHGGEARRAAAEAHLAAALAESPGHSLALSELGALRLEEGRVNEARELLARASAGGDALAAFRYALALLESAPLKDATRSSASVRDAREAVRAALRTSVSRDPRFGEAYVLLALNCRSSATLDEGIEALDAAIRLLPARRELLGSLAEFYELKGDSLKADGLLRAAGPDGADSAARVKRMRAGSPPSKKDPTPTPEATAAPRPAP